QQLADKQRDLMKQTQKARDDLGWFPGEKEKKKYGEALDRISQQQQQLNKQATQLPAEGAQKTLEQAREAMNQAQQALDKKDGAQAQTKQRDAADALQKLAQGLPQQPPPRDPQAQQGPLDKQQGEQARDLARQQRDLRDMVEKVARRKPANQDQQQAK